MSQVTQLKTGAATGNADIEQYSYDQQTGLLTNQKVIKQNTSQTLMDLSYNYNRGNSKGSLNGKTGQLTHIVDNLDRNKDRVYEFDTLGRLATAKGGLAAGGTGSTANWTQDYGYDRYGNRPTVTASGVTADGQAVPTDGWGSMGYESQTNRIATAGYQYDLAGNLVRGQAADGSWQLMEYDSAGRLITVKRESDGLLLQRNQYGSSRERAASWNYVPESLRWYVWGGSAVLAEYTAPSWGWPMTWAKSYVYAGSRLLSTFTSNGAGGETLEFNHPDRLGTKLVTNNQANTSFEQSTLPFGTALNAESSGYSNQVFTSYDRSSTASLDYAVNRTYSPGQGRFTTVDPIGMASTSPGNPQSFNLFAYVQNNPIDFVDPSGLLLLVCYGDDTFLDSTYNGVVTGTVYLGFTASYCVILGGGGGGGGTHAGGDSGDVSEGPGGGETSGDPDPDSDPCAGRKGTLDFSKNVKKHIFRRHIATSTSPDASKYTFWPWQRTRNQYESQVISFGQTTFENGKAVKEGDRVVYSYAFSGLDFGDVWAFREVGFDSESGLETNVNTIVIKDDCKTVITSYPGLPWQFDVTDIPGAIFKSGGFSTQHKSGL